MKKNNNNNKGFTLVELLVVIAIIGILAVVAVPALFKNINKAKAADLKADYNAFKSASLSYYTDTNKYPVKLTQTDQTKKDDLDEYMEKVPVKSPFGTDYVYKEPTGGEAMVITTVLADGISKELQDIIEKDTNDQIKVNQTTKTITMTIISNTAGLTPPSTSGR